MMFGKFPFDNNTEIINKKLRFPGWASAEKYKDVRSLIKKLLNKNPKKRLGSGENGS